MQKVPCALHALWPREDATRQEPRQATLLLAQALRMHLPPLVRDQAVEEAVNTRMHRCRFGKFGAKIFIPDNFSQLLSGPNYSILNHLIYFFKLALLPVSGESKT